MAVGNFPDQHVSAQYRYRTTMKLITSVALCASAAMAFVNTAPMYANEAFFKDHYLTDVHDVSSQVDSLTKELCSDSQHLPLIIARVKHLSKKSSDLAKVSTNVRYESSKQLDLALHSSCQVHYSTSLPKEISAGNIYVADLDDETEYTPNELLEKGVKMIVQGKPSGAKSRSFMAGIKGYMGDFQQGWAKREEEDAEEDVAAYAEVESAFRAAESMIAHEEGDSFVTALADDKEISSGIKESKVNANTTSNLFTKYQFFTPGIWSCLIVSLFLVYVLNTALGWITSIQVTYKSFEKQVDYEKKTE
ncbi:uncharacterized protein CXQ87_000815 [Candidozyma duobushaemuli]|nr:uncharacterized protein CXQ87_000815 [[Candida] duobushaemulonis]PVH17914.1 hypothetical protein CXQ87_000815 [[Candida] duobushaemulonis]